ncbi:MAG: CDP-alcohol phosphatidyltransferase family protein [bacterium]|nr:CDP-alcohol phosphatidyltransferase family protein [bacterium]
MNKKITLSNMISLSRIVLLPLVAIIIRKNTYQYNYFALFLLLIFVATDFLDGFLARRLHQISKLGKILDPLADKICIVTISYLLFLYKNFPLWAFLFLLIREFFILSGGIILLKKKNIIFSSNIAGKLGTFFISLSLLGYLLLGTDYLLPYTLLIISFTLYFVAFLLYMLDYMKVMSYVKLTKKVQKILSRLFNNVF